MTRRHITFKEADKTPYGEAYLSRYMERYQLKASDAVEKIFEEHALLIQAKENEDFLGELLTERLKKDVGLIRLRTGYADKNMQIMLELFNTLIFHLGVPKALLTTVQETTPLQEAKQKVEAMIQANVEKKSGQKRKTENAAEDKKEGQAK